MRSSLDGRTCLIYFVRNRKDYSSLTTYDYSRRTDWRRQHQRNSCSAANAIAGVSIAAIYGTNQARVARLSQEYAAQPYTDFEAFLNHRALDIIAIGSPSGL